MATNAIVLSPLYIRINIISHHYDKRQNNFLFYDLYIAIMAQFLSLLNGVHQINHPRTYWDNSSIPYKKETYRWDKWALNLFTLHLFIMIYFDFSFHIIHWNWFLQYLIKWWSMNQATQNEFHITPLNLF